MDGRLKLVGLFLGFVVYKLENEIPRNSIFDVIGGLFAFLSCQSMSKPLGMGHSTLRLP